MSETITISKLVNNYVIEHPRNAPCMYIITYITGINYIDPHTIIHPTDDEDIISMCKMYDQCYDIRKKFELVKDISPLYRLVYNHWEQFHDLYTIMLSEEPEVSDDHLIPSKAKQDIQYLMKTLIRQASS